MADGTVSGQAAQPDMVTMVVPAFTMTGGLAAFFACLNVWGWDLADAALIMCAVFTAMAAMAGVRYARRGWFPNVLIAAVFSLGLAIMILLVWGP